jgi:hypothetical protein
MHPDLLQRFCAIDDHRVWLRAPWRDGGHIYATNRHIVVRINDDGRDVEPASNLHPKLPALFKKYASIDGFVPIPDLIPEPPCEVCDGNGGHDGADCDECEGGTFEHGSHTYECKNCDDGRLEPAKICLACDGFGSDGSMARMTSRTAIGTTEFQTRYLRFLAKLQGIMIAPNGSECAPFKFRGGRGLIMPMAAR